MKTLPNLILSFIVVLVILAVLLTFTVIWAGLQFLRISSRDFRHSFNNGYSFSSNLNYIRGHRCDCDDFLYNVDFGGKIPSIGQFDVFFQYNSSDTRKCIVSLADTTDNNARWATATVDNLTAGLSQNRSITLSSYEGSLPVGTDYTLIIQLFDSNSVLTAYFTQSVTVEAGKQGFFISQGNVIGFFLKNMLIYSF